MKNLVKFLSLVLILCLLVPTALAQGGYTETEWVPPKGYILSTNLCALLNGGFGIVAIDEATGSFVLLSLDSLTAQPKITPLALPAGAMPSLLRAGKDGSITLLMTCYEAPAADEGQTGASFSMDGITTLIATYDQKGQAMGSFEVEGYVHDIALMDEGSIAVFTFGTDILLLDAKGNQIANLGNPDAIGMIAAGEHLFVMKSDKYVELDLGGSIIRTVESLHDYTAQFIYAGGSLYGLSTQGFYCLGPDAMTFEKLSSAARYRLGAAEGSLSAVCALNDGTLIATLGNGLMMASSGAAFYNGGGESSYMVYTYDPVMDTSSSPDFVITALRDSARLRKAAALFQQAHPEINVVLNTVLGEYDFETPVEDGVRTLNTALLSGKAGDILILDGLPVDKYTEKGILKPLDSLLENAGILPGILSGSRAKDGHIYVCPQAFSVDTRWARKTVVEKLGSLEALASLTPNENGDVLYPRAPSELLELFYATGIEALKEEDGTMDFNSPAFIEYLNNLYSLYTGQSTQPVAQSEEPGSLNMEELQAIQNETVLVFPFTLNSTLFVSIPYTFMGLEEAGVLVPHYYTPMFMAGINGKSQQVKLCEGFMELLFSKDMQELELGDGMPVTQSALEALIERAKPVEVEGDMMAVSTMALATGEGNPITLEMPSAAILDALAAQLKRVDTPVIVDETLLSFMKEETAPFFRGEISAQSAASALYARSLNYLSE